MKGVRFFKGRESGMVLAVFDELSDYNGGYPEGYGTAYRKAAWHSGGKLVETAVIEWMVKGNGGTRLQRIPEREARNRAPELVQALKRRIAP